MTIEAIQLSLTLAEGLVLCEWLTGISSTAIPHAHPAEMDVLLRLEGRLEKVLPQLFAEDCVEWVRKAREEVRAPHEPL